MRFPQNSDDLPRSSDPEWTLVGLSENPDTSANMITEVPQDLNDLDQQSGRPCYDFTVPLDDLSVIKK